MNRMYEKSKELHRMLNRDPLKLLTLTMKDLNTNCAMFEKPSTLKEGTELLPTLDCCTNVDTTDVKLERDKNSPDMTQI